MRAVLVECPSRLHLSLLDMNGTVSGRVDGGVGFALSEPSIVVTVTPLSGEQRDEFAIERATDHGEINSAIRGAIERMREDVSFGRVGVRVAAHPALHQGFGSKTAILLSVLAGIDRGLGTSASINDFWRWSQRGGTSGIGLRTFFDGGFIVDAGHCVRRKSRLLPSSASVGAGIPPLVGRYEFPQDWPVLVVVPNARRIHGAIEEQLFDEVCPIPMSDVRSASHIVLMMMIPSLLERDVASFADALNRLSVLRWKKFEIEAQDAIVSKVIDGLRAEEGLGVGMSSWGPAIVCVGTPLSSAISRERVVNRAKDLIAASGGSLFLTHGANSGARFRVE